MVGRLPTRRIHAYIEGPTLDRMARHVPAQLGQSVNAYVNEVLNYFESKLLMPKGKIRGK